MTERSGLYPYIGKVRPCWTSSDYFVSQSSHFSPNESIPIEKRWLVFLRGFGFYKFGPLPLSRTTSNWSLQSFPISKTSAKFTFSPPDHFSKPTFRPTILLCLRVTDNLLHDDAVDLAQPRVLLAQDRAPSLLFVRYLQDRKRSLRHHK
jgi:hypothetical protein